MFAVWEPSQWKIEKSVIEVLNIFLQVCSFLMKNSTLIITINKFRAKDIKSLMGASKKTAENILNNKKHKNAVKVEIPEYQTIREIVFEGTARGGNNKQFMFLDRNKQLQELNFNQTFYRIRTLSTYFYSKGLKNGKKIAIVSENLIDWGFAYYAIIVGGNVCVPMDAKLTYEDIRRVLGFDIDHSFLKYKKELLEYGYEVVKISIKEKYVLIHKIESGIQ